jgi:hypothetical protein
MILECAILRGGYKHAARGLYGRQFLTHNGKLHFGVSESIMSGVPMLLDAIIAYDLPERDLSFTLA